MKDLPPPRFLVFLKKIIIYHEEHVESNDEKSPAYDHY